MRTVTTSVALVWKPARYAVRWACEPSEVPDFDPSRGGDPFFPAPSPDDPDVEVRFIQRDLGGHQPPPSPAGDYWVEAVDATTGEPWAYPMRYDNYPRLVRETHQDVGVVSGEIRALEPVADLARFTESPEFMELARLTMERLGALAYGEFDYTVGAWMHAAVELDTHLRLLRLLGEVAEGEGRPEDQLRLDDDHRSRFNECLGSLDWELAVPTVQDLRSHVAGSPTLDALREGLSDMYWGEFVRSTRPYAHPGAWFRQATRPSWGQVNLVDLSAIPGQGVVRCGCRGWAFHELWQRSTRHSTVRRCEGCGRHFAPPRKDARHCSGACRVKSFRQRGGRRPPEATP
jgi:hypothetical protein